MKTAELANYGFPVEAIKVLESRGISELNPVQRMAIKKGVLSGKNIVVATPTASGKTLIGEIALIKSVFEGKIGLYLVPLRALASEKYQEFKVWNKIDVRVGISTGDYESPGEHLGRYNIIVATYERFDSILRLEPSWIKRIGAVVIDELHMVTDPERGPVLEMIISRLLDMGNIQIVGLSATIGNPHELAKWINGELVDLPWRPVKLVEGVFDRRSHKIVFIDGRCEKIIHRLENPALSIALQSIGNGYQVLIFVNNRRRAEEWAYMLVDHMKLLVHLVDKRKVKELLDELKQSPSRSERERLEYLVSRGVAYHHAGLSSIARSVVEKGFRERVIKAVFATPTLAAGVNLPARRVLVSIKRYDPVRRRMMGIPVFEYKQMAGRAGRPLYDEVGEAIIYDSFSLREGLDKYVRGRVEPVTSKLNSERSLRIHVLALFASGKAGSLDDVIRVFEKTLFRIQYGSLTYIRSVVGRVIDELMQWGMLTTTRNHVIPTKLGRTTSITYLDPLTVHRFIEKTPENPGTLWLLHVICMAPDYQRSKPYINNKVLDYYEQEAWDLADNGLIIEPPSLDKYDYHLWLVSFVHALMLRDWINEETEDKISEKYGVGPGDIYSARDTASWIAGALSRIDDILGKYDRSDKLRKLGLRLEFGVKEDALELVQLRGIGRVRARTLISHGIRSLNDLARTPKEKLLKLPGFGPKIVEDLYEQLKEKGYI